MKKYIAVVAGASRGAGKGIALALAEIGATVYIIGRSSQNDIEKISLGTIEETADEVTKLGGGAIPYKCDCSDPDQVKKLFATIDKKHGRLDLLVNSAWGGHDMEPKTNAFFENVDEEWHYMFDKGVKNYLLCSCAAVPLLKKTTNSMLVNISFWDDNKYTMQLMYDLAKNTMNRLAFGMHKELSKFDVTSLSISPGYMNTERVQKALQEVPSLAEKFGTPSESTSYVGRAIVALLLDKEKSKKSGLCLRVGDLAKEYGFTDIDGSQPGAFKLPEVQ